MKKGMMEMKEIFKKPLPKFATPFVEILVDHLFINLIIAMFELQWNHP